MRSQYVMKLLLVVMCFTSCAQNAQSVSRSQNKELDATVKLKWEEQDFLLPYRDSLRNILVAKKIPYFLKNDCFDYDNSFFLKPRHQPISFRKQLLMSIENVAIVNYLLKNKNLISNKECEEVLEHPYGGKPSKLDTQSQTNVDMLLIRKEELSH